MFSYNIQISSVFAYASLYNNNLGRSAKNPVFGVSDKVRFKPACSATETSFKIEISLVSSLDMILSNKRITKALIRLRRCAGWSAPVLFVNPQDRFSSVNAHMDRTATEKNSLRGL